MSELVTATAFLLSINQEAHLAVHFTIAPQWHIYWENPGDSGLATEIEAVGLQPEVQYMGPEKIITDGGITNYGYHNQTILFGTVEESFSNETPIHLSWLVCKADQCIRGQQTISAQTATMEQSTFLRASFRQLPKPLPTEWIQSRDSDTMIIQLPKQQDIQVFPNEILERQLRSVSTDHKSSHTFLELDGKQAFSTEAEAVLRIQSSSETEYYLLSF